MAGADREGSGLLRTDVPIQTCPSENPLFHEVYVVEAPVFKTADDIASWLERDVPGWLYTACALFGEADVRAYVGSRILVDLVACCDAVAKCLRTGVLPELRDLPEDFAEKVIEAMVLVTEQQDPNVDSKDLTRLLASVQRGMENESQAEEPAETVPG